VLGNDLPDPPNVRFYLFSSLPHIPGVTYNGLMTTGDLLDYGPSFNDGVLTMLPPILVGSPYQAFVPKTDADGNDITGIRLPEIEVPLGTYTGWGLRVAAFGGDDLCDGAGQKIDFRRTRAERLAVGDPRLSFEERYGDFDNYLKAVTDAARKLNEQRLMLGEDVEQVIREARHGLGTLNQPHARKSGDPRESRRRVGCRPTVRPRSARRRMPESLHGPGHVQL
jgi:hypothetical protein